MNLKEYQSIANQIGKLYSEMDKENDAFSKTSGLQCVSTCGGVCCQNKSVAVPPADLLPLALEIIKENRSEEVLMKLNEEQDQACMFYKLGKCSVYQNRATLCRLFAFSSVYNKQGQKTLSVCSYIKENQNTEFDQETINKSANIVDWSIQVSSLLPNWDSSCLPFNKALKYALEKVILSTQYESKEIL